MQGFYPSNLSQAFQGIIPYAYGTQDPSVVATPGTQGQLFLRLPSGIIYFTTELLSGSSLENSDHMKKYEIVNEWDLNPTPEQDIQLKRNFIDTLHIQYSVLKLLYILYKRLFGITIKSKNKDQFQICSENIIRMLDHKKQLKSYDGIGLKEAILLLENKFIKEN